MAMKINRGELNDESACRTDNTLTKTEFTEPALIGGGRRGRDHGE